MRLRTPCSVPPSQSLCRKRARLACKHQHKTQAQAQPKVQIFAHTVLESGDLLRFRGDSSRAHRQLDERNTAS